MLIKVLMITYNRPDYTFKSLTRLCSTSPDNVKITIWDNGSNASTKEIIRKFSGHPRVEKIIYSENNKKLREPTNWFWKSNLDADLLGKVDDDCLVPNNWCSILEQAHQDIPNAGALACWHFLKEDFNIKIAQKKIQRYGEHSIFRNCWVGGTGYLMKKDVISRIGHIKANENFTDYCIRAASKGFVNGWYFPLIYQEHMDDPRTPNTGIKTEEDFLRLLPLSAKNFNIKTREQWIQRLKLSAKNIQEYSVDPNDFIGIKAKIKKYIYKLIGVKFLPRV